MDAPSHTHANGAVEPPRSPNTWGVGLGEHADESWLDFLPHDLVTRARTRALGARVLSRIVLSHYGLAGEIDAEVDNKHRWMRAEPDALRGEALHLGIDALAPLVRQVIDRRRAQDLRSGFGEPAYRAALEGEPFPVEPLPVEAFARCAAPDDFRLLASRIGLALMMDALRTDAAPLARRLQLLFPRGCREPLRPRPHAGDGAALARRLDRIRT